MALFYRSIAILFLGSAAVFYGLNFLLSDDICDSRLLRFSPLLVMAFSAYIFYLGKKLTKENIKIGGGLFMLIGGLGTCLSLLSLILIIVTAVTWCRGYL